MKALIFLFLLLTNFTAISQQLVNQLDENGKKHGVWKGYYEDTKNPRYEGTFDHGKETGVFSYFDNSTVKSVIATREFFSDNSAYTVFFDQNKNKISEGRVMNKVYEGQWKYYHKGGKVIMTLENYANGNLEGLKSVFYPDGKIAEETIYSNGIKSGPYKKYTQKGIVLEEATYKNNEFHGLAIYKDPDDNIVAKGLFKEGKKVGIWQFYQSGKLVSEENFNKPPRKFQKRKNVRKEE